jgi:chromosome segregation ATPase
MENHFEQIRQQIHEIRNFLGPLDLKLEGLDQQITKSRISFESRASELESKIAEHTVEMARHSELIRQIQVFLKMPLGLENRSVGPVHEDKQNPGNPPISPREP